MSFGKGSRMLIGLLVTLSKLFFPGDGDGFLGISWWEKFVVVGYLK